jgi:hypothetical protein
MTNWKKKNGFFEFETAAATTGRSPQQALLPMQANTGGWTSDKRVEFDKLEKEIDRLGAAAADAERREKSELVNDAKRAGIEESNWHEKKAAQTKNVITEEMRKNAFRAWCFGGQPSAVRSEWAEAAKACGVDMRSPEISLDLLKQASADRSDEELRARINDHITYRATTAQSINECGGRIHGCRPTTA